jgi:hypothetical protein
MHLSDKIYTSLKISINKLHMLRTTILDICSNLVSCNVTMSAFDILMRFLICIHLFTSCSPLTFQEIIFGFTRNQLRYVRLILLCFKAVLGLKVNLGKSELMAVGEIENIGNLTAYLGCRVAGLPMKYLGLLLAAAYKATSTWNGVTEQMGRRLAGWKKIYLSKGGQLTLIKSMLSNLPTYYLSLFPVPMSVANRIEKIQQDFLWRGMGDENKLHLVSWN